MAPSEGDGVQAPAERALSFISRSLTEVQRSTGKDMTELQSRLQSLREKSKSLDVNWKESSLANFPAKAIKDGRNPLNLSVEDFDLLKSLKPKIDRSWSDTSMQGRKNELWVAPQMDKALGFGKDRERGVAKPELERRVLVKSRKKVRVSEKSEEPLKKVKKTVEEKLRDLETTAATSKTPVQFFENMKQTEFFETMKKNLKLSKGPESGADVDKQGTDVAPLSVPELLESLVRQSEPLLDHLGVKKEVTEKLRDMVGSSKHKGLQLSSVSAGSKRGLAAKKQELSTEDELDLRIASVIQSTGYKHNGGPWTKNQILKKTTEDLRRNIAIVTTASLPWMTGTAVNPLFRAAYLARSGDRKVTLLVPWLCKNDQVQVYPNQMTFECPAEQENVVRKWVEDRVGFKCDFKIAFYPGKFSTEKRSILAAGDVSQFIPDQEADVAVLEHAYKVLRLSAATQNLPRSSVCNVHGVNPQFLSIGKRFAEADSNEPKFSKGAYYLGKMIWGKGYRELVDLLAQNKEFLGNINMDVFGSGEDSDAVKAEAQKYGLALNFHQGRDHADASLHGYKVFINPSISDVVCTTTAEALAMGKIVVCADHPSNEFFRSFPNCYTYRTPEEFVEKVKLALASEPQPLVPELQHLLSWEAATDRFIDSAEIKNLPPRGATTTKGKRKRRLPIEAAKGKTMTLSLVTLPKKMLAGVLDSGLSYAHYFLSGIEIARRAAGALPGTKTIGEEFRKDLVLPPPKTVYGR